MRFIKLAGVATLALVLAACGATVKGMGEDLKRITSPAPVAQVAPQTSGLPVGAMAHANCNNPAEQKRCMGWRTLVLKWNPDHQRFRGYNMHPATLDERQSRQNTAGPSAAREYREGRLQSAGSKTVYYLMWNVNPAPLSHLAGYSLNGHSLAEMPATVAQEISGPRVESEVPGLGRPHFVYRVTSHGAGAAGVELGMPWTMRIPGKTYIFRCLEGGVLEQVYPPSSDGKNPDAHRTGPASIDWLAEKESRQSTAVFFVR